MISRQCALASTSILATDHWVSRAGSEGAGMSRIDEWAPYRGKIVEALFAWRGDRALVCGRVVDPPPGGPHGDELALEAPDGRRVSTYYCREVTRVLDDWPDGPLAYWGVRPGQVYEVDIYGPPTWQANPELYSGRLVSAFSPAKPGSLAEQIHFYGRVAATVPADAPTEIAEAVAANRMLCFEAPDGRWFATDDVSISEVCEHWPFERSANRSNPNLLIPAFVAWNHGAGDDGSRLLGRPDPEALLYGPATEYPEGSDVPSDANLAGRLVEVEDGDGRRLCGILVRYREGRSGAEVTGATFWPAEAPPFRLGPAHRLVATRRCWPAVDPDQVPPSRRLEWSWAFDVSRDQLRQAGVGDIVELMTYTGRKAEPLIIGRLERCDQSGPAHELTGAVLSDPDGQEHGVYAGKVLAVYTRWPEPPHRR